MPRTFQKSPTRLHNDIFYCAVLALGLKSKCYLERVHHDRRHGATQLRLRIKQASINEVGLADNCGAMRYSLWLNHGELQKSQDASAVVMRKVQYAQRALEDDLFYVAGFVQCFRVPKDVDFVV